MRKFISNISAPVMCLTLVVIGIAFMGDQAYDLGHRLGGLLYRITH